METFVKGTLPSNQPIAKAIQNRLVNLGYDVNGEEFKKPGKIESVITELVPMWEWYGLNAWKMELAEFQPDLDKPTAVYENGKIQRAD